VALQTSGAISLNQIHIEAGGSSGTACTLNDADIRGLIGKGSGSSNSFSEYYGASSEVYFYGYFSGTLTTTAQAYNTWLNAFIAATSATKLYFYFGTTSTKPSPYSTVTTNVQNYRSAIVNNQSYGTGTSTQPYLGRGCGNTSYNTTGKSSCSWHLNNQSSCSCDGAGNRVIRPHIGNSNWGGVNGGCGQPAQYMGIGFS
jgi:hypothetical protein